MAQIIAQIVLKPFTATSKMNMCGSRLDTKLPIRNINVKSANTNMITLSAIPKLQILTDVPTVPVV